MTEKEKAAPQNGTTPITHTDVTTAPTSAATKLELVALHLVENGTNGISSLSALAGLHDLNPRNSISKLRRLHGVRISDEYFSHQHSGGGVARLKRYWVADRDQARKVAVLVNHWRRARNELPLSQEQIARYLVAFPTKSDHQPAA
ncbi:hypothetical protein [Aeromonas sp. QDB66]|uniref:hypothetical protein n=1 Tax=Aeromonas sp. QDB66 TaxID=2989824 RepID=UPI0022E966CA|nr:hypothetical protein [Aeromonas sp. QDB66]